MMSLTAGFVAMLGGLITRLMVVNRLNVSCVTVGVMIDSLFLVRYTMTRIFEVKTVEAHDWLMDRVEHGKGSRDCARKALQQGKPVFVVVVSDC